MSDAPDAQDELERQICQSKVILFKRYCPNTQTHTGASGQPGPLKLLVKTACKKLTSEISEVQIFC